MSARAQCREVAGLISVMQCACPVSFARVRRPRGAKGAGLRYERALAAAVSRALPHAQHGQWLRFRDANGAGYAQPDIMIVGQGAVVVLECKLTDTEGARVQLRGLYMPLLRALYPAAEVRGIVVTRHLTRATREELVCERLDDAISRANGVIPTLHWIGTGRI